MEPLLKTVIHDQHVKLGAQMVAFGGWDMPVQYRTGIVQEHLATRNHAGVFDVSHMGRIHISGPSALAFLQHVLSNNAAGLEVGESQYTLIPDEQGGAVDDAYLYRFVPDEYLLVVNASNRKKDLAHFQAVLSRFPDVRLTDHTADTAMISLQGPRSRDILAAIMDSGHFPEPMKNRLSTATLKGTPAWIGRTGYTGEPLGFEMFVPANAAPALWNLLAENGACPAGLGARDTLRLEAGLPLYGHELGLDEKGNEIPVFSLPLSRIAVSFSDFKADFIGKPALFRQFQALKLILDRDFSRIQDLPRMIFPLAVTDKGVIRSGCQVYQGEKPVGYITSGTMVPYQKVSGQGMGSCLTSEKGMRSVGLALLDSDLCEGDMLNVDIRGKMTPAVIVPYHLRSEAPPFARPILHDRIYQTPGHSSLQDVLQKVDMLVEDAARNSIWRQQECINLIPSEQTPSKLVRLLSVLDPCGRYAEHKKMKAFSEADVFYYQGVDFIEKVEHLLQQELCAYFGCAQVEPRLISGQMANTTVFSALCDFLNRSDRKCEQRRIRRVLNHHIIKGGHLSAQPMGALRDFVARDPQTEKPSVINFPVLEENPYQIDVAASCKLIADYQPELIIFGKSMILHREPIADIRAFVDSQNMDCVLLYDMAHVLGLCGPYYQDPFREGADIVTGSTHKTFFGTQRGVIASDFNREDCIHYPLWEAVERRAFPGSVSNHHLGTLVGLLMATYEMNAFKAGYQKQVIENAKAFAAALKDCGLDVAGDPAISFTETHQVILSVGYARGPEMARRLEDSHIIVNYQAAPDEEGFTAAGALRMGVAEMTRFGMKETDFQTLAELIQDVIVRDKPVKTQVSAFRKRFQQMQYCFSDKEIPRIQKVLEAIV